MGTFSRVESLGLRLVEIYQVRPKVQQGGQHLSLSDPKSTRMTGGPKLIKAVEHVNAVKHVNVAGHLNANSTKVIE